MSGRRAHRTGPQFVVLLFRRLHADGFAVRSWGVCRKVVDTGANGMTIDFPDVALAYLAARR